MLNLNRKLHYHIQYLASDYFIYTAVNSLVFSCLQKFYNPSNSLPGRRWYVYTGTRRHSAISRYGSRADLYSLACPGLTEPAGVYAHQVTGEISASGPTQDAKKTSFCSSSLQRQWTSWQPCTSCGWRRNPTGGHRPPHRTVMTTSENSICKWGVHKPKCFGVLFNLNTGTT